MGYFVRVLSKHSEPVSLSKLRQLLWQNSRSATLKIQSGTESQWDQALLAHSDGTPITLIEKSFAIPRSLAEREIKEFLREIERRRPKSAIHWLRQYLAGIKSIYSFQILGGTEQNNGWHLFDRILQATHKASMPSIIQSDGEGFSNEDGFDIVWLCPHPFGQSRKVAVWIDNKWNNYELDLTNSKHCAAFRRGEIPNNISLLSDSVTNG